MQREKNQSKLLSRRSALLGGGQLALLGILVARMYQLQVVDAKRFATLADKNRISVRWLSPSRGRIVDRFGVSLADGRPTYRVLLVPEQVDDIESTLSDVATLVPIGDMDRRRILRDLGRKRGFVPVMIGENLSWDQMARIEVNAPELPGVSIEQGLTRHYPFGPSASHVIGYVAAVAEKDLIDDDPLLELPDFRIGKSGIEKTYDLELRGGAGTSQVEVNALGRVVRELAREDGSPGKEVVLSLDMALQEMVARRCDAEKGAAAVLLDAWTGEVLALVSSPGYDPVSFTAGISSAKWNELTTDPLNPLSDRAIGGTYAPGSTFKPIVALAALETGAIAPDTHFFCPGYFLLGNAVFHCWKKSGHGNLAVRDAIKHSCDVFFYNTAHRLGIDLIADMAKRFGLGATLGLDIPGERPGIIPTTQWKLDTTGIPWQAGETISAGIGQSYILATPLQLAVQVARLVTGRAVVPRLVRTQGIMTRDSAVAASVRPDFIPLPVSPKDLALVLNGMVAVVNEPEGTAYAARILEPGMQMGGKSGTSQVRHISQAEREHGLRKGDDVPWKERDHALFIAFAPVGAPRYVCAVVVEHGGASGGGGSAVAAPICRDVLREAQMRDPARRIPEHLASAEKATVET